MKALVIYKSVHQGNTKKVADVIAKVLKAEIKQPEDVKDISNYDIIGFGSGIYGWMHHKSLLKLAETLDGKTKKAFIFSTSGMGTAKQHTKIKEKLKEKGFKVLAEFACKGLDKFGPLALIGGMNKGKPDKEDLKKAEEFAKKLIKL